MGGAGVSEANGVLEGASCRRSGAAKTKNHGDGRGFLFGPGMTYTFLNAQIMETE